MRFVNWRFRSFVQYISERVKNKFSYLVFGNESLIHFLEFQREKNAIIKFGLLNLPRDNDLTDEQ